MEAKTLTLVERLKDFEAPIRNGDVPDMFSHDADLIAEAISALEAAQKALEPFGIYGELFVGDGKFCTSEDDAVWMSCGERKFTAGDLRLARSVHSMLIGEDKTKGDIKEANNEG